MVEDEESDTDPVLLPVGVEALQLILWTIRFRQSRLEPVAVVIVGM